MWKKNTPPKNRDLDEIISDEDESDRVTYRYGHSKNLESLHLHGKKVQLTAISQLDCSRDKKQHLMVGSHEVNPRQTNFPSALGNLENFCSGYEIGVHGYKDEKHKFAHPLSNKHRVESGDESISDEENAAISKLSDTAASANFHKSIYNSSEHEKQEACTWSAVIEEARALACVHKEGESRHVILPRKDVHRGGRGRAKVKFSFPSLSHKEDLSWSSVLEDENEEPFENMTEDSVLHNTIEHKTIANSIDELSRNILAQSYPLHATEVSDEQERAESSMADLLEDLQQKDGHSASNMFLQDTKAKERNVHIAGKRTLSHLGPRILDNEDPLVFRGCGSSSEDENIDQNQLCVVTQKDKEQTMADRFQEAFTTSEVEGLQFPAIKQFGLGYHGRLLQVLQIEKDRHLEFLKHSEPEQSPNDSVCMDVQILSRILEAKLTVCQCLCSENTNMYQKCAHDGGTMKRTVIFSSKICDNVELEVGNLVRIHPPWKDVLVNEDEKIILCTYFSQIND